MWKWIGANRLIAATIALAFILVCVSVADGLSARRAARQYFDRAWEWARAYDRDTAAAKKEYEAKIKTLTEDRDAYRVKWEAAKKKLGAAWDPPSNAKALQERFNKIGYRGRLK